MNLQQALQSKGLLARAGDGEKPTFNADPNWQNVERTALRLGEPKPPTQRKAPKKIWR